MLLRIFRVQQLAMTPIKLLQLLMHKSGDNTNSLSVRLGGKPSQPQIYRFLKGESKEPKRSTLQPIADYYRVNIDAFYDPQIAADVADAMAGKEIIVKPLDKPPEKPPLSVDAVRLASLLDMIPPYDLIRRSKAYSAAMQAIIGVIEQHPATTSLAADQKTRSE